MSYAFRKSQFDPERTSWPWTLHPLLSCLHYYFISPPSFSNSSNSFIAISRCILIPALLFMEHQMSLYYFFFINTAIIFLMDGETILVPFN